MQWSKLKVNAERLLCESLKGRVHYQMVVHRKSHDQTGTFRMTMDGVEIFSASDIPYTIAVNTRESELINERALKPIQWSVDWQEMWASNERILLHEAHDDAEAEVESNEQFHSSEIRHLLFDYLNLPFEEAVVHKHPFVKAISLFDRRFGKRRLAEFDSEKATGLVKKFYDIRVEADR